MVRWFIIALLVVTSADAFAQLNVPGRLPDLPVGLPETPLDRPDSLLDELDDRVLDDIEDARRDALNTVFRDNRDVLERGPRGSVILRGEVIAVDPDSDLLDRALQRGFVIIEDRTEAALDIRFLRLRAPVGVGTRRALRILRQFDPDGLFDLNHIYLPSGLSAAQQASPPALLNSAVRIGVIDAGVPADSAHFATGQVTSRAFRGNGVEAHLHGLQVAAILASSDGVVPGARLYAADVYGGQPTGGSADTLLQALGWMAEEDVRVVNISIVGPANIALQAAVRRFTGQGRIIVAAVGNDGASADPLYPAAYAPVIAVTGIDASGRVLPEAIHGRHVDFAARGMDMAWPTLSGQHAQVRGTSFAAPIVAGLLVARFEPDQSSEETIAGLIASARDLGRSGKDRIYGYGAVGEHLFANTQARLQ